MRAPLSNPLRRRLMSYAALLPASALPGPAAAAGRVDYPVVTPRALVFPRDFGAHPEFRTEWWYLTGWLEASGTEPPLGFQLTFFRTRPDVRPATDSAFAAEQVVIAHAALADARVGHLLHDERIARAGFGAAYAGTDDTALKLDRWRFVRDAASGVYRAEIPARAFTLALTATPTQPPLLQGQGGWSRKGPFVEQASYYYTQPQLAVQAEVRRDGRSERRRGIGWLDHEWSSTLLDPRAAGWDWVGMNLDDGAALTAFRIRPQAGAGGSSHEPLRAYASLRARGGAVQVFGPESVRFATLESWRSPRTGAVWPVAQRLRVGEREFEIRPLMPDQELDSRRSTGAVYWEGASTLSESGRAAGRGYLEMTGYLEPMRL
jgi:predicted secreted hydrolase